ncbi:DUF4116 domain-containing protein, partial [Chlamydiales bacterium]|nr:DUF4116 domain-containing protein [Chlamydiales bacterium]
RLEGYASNSGIIIDRLSLKEIVIVSVRFYPKMLSILGRQYTNDEDVVLAGLEKWEGQMLCYASEEMRNNRRIVLVSLRQSGKNYASVGDTLRYDPTIIFYRIFR